MKYALVTIAAGDYYQQMARITHPTLQAYAHKVGAEFIVWTDVSGYEVAGYKKMELGRLLDDYDRVLYIDTDILVRPDAPNLFDLVPDDQLGMFEEGQYFDRTLTTIQLMTVVDFDARNWDGKYYNSGVMLFSKCHRDLLSMPPQQFDHLGEQTWLNVLICAAQATVFPLPYRCNRMLTLDNLLGEERLDSWFLHYASAHQHDHQKVLGLIAGDLEAWRRAAPEYRFPHNVALIVQGGLADQIAAEPAVRYAREVIYRHDNLAVVSTLPEVFAHCGALLVGALEQVPMSAKFHSRYTREYPGAEDEILYHQVHGTTLASMMALGLELPVACRTPRLAVPPDALAALRDKLGAADLTSLVLLHPGRGLPANTFPADVWQSYLDALLARGFPVAVIGNRTGDDWGSVEFDRSRAIDLVDRLSLAEMIALISQAPVLVSNDSAPVQIAGAFDGWIGLLATLRHADYVLPWRNRSLYFRAKSLARFPLCVDYFHNPSGSEQPSLDACDEARLRACLPEANAVVEFVAAALA